MGAFILLPPPPHFFKNLNFYYYLFVLRAAVLGLLRLLQTMLKKRQY